MSNSPQPFTDVELDHLATRPRTLHEPSDCIAMVRRMIATTARTVHGGNDLERGDLLGASLRVDRDQVRDPTKEPPEISPWQILDRVDGVETGTPPRDVRCAPARAFTLESVNKLAAKLRALPPAEPSRRSLNKQEMVRHLAREIAALQRRGYTLEEVAESLRSSDVEISTPTLKSYLHRSKKSSGAGTGKRGRRSIAQNGGGDERAPTAALKGEAFASGVDRQTADDHMTEGLTASFFEVFGSPVTTDPDVQVRDDDSDPLWDLPDL